MDKRRKRLLQERRFALKVWAAVLLVGFVGVLAGGMFLWLRSMSGRAVQASPGVAGGPQPIVRTLEVIPPTEREALHIVRGAMAARDAETLREFVHATEEVPADAMLAFFSQLTERHGEVHQFQWLGTPDVPYHLQVQLVNVVFEKDFLRATREARLLPDEDAVWKLDFPSFARWSDPPIELLETEAGHPGGRIRAIFGHDTFFSGPFVDDREWACFVFMSPNTESRGLAYARRGSAQYQMMNSLLPPGPGGVVRATVEIRRVDGANKRQFELTRVYSGDWFASEFATSPERR